MAKRIRISDDAGVNYYTLPGNTGQLSDEVGAIDDTIFGQDFGSNQPGMIASSVQANGFYKGFAGYVAKIFKSGAATAFTAEPMTLVSGKTYKITDATKNMWSRATVPTVLVSAVAVATSNILEIDYLFGRVTFISSYTPGGPVTVTGSYMPKTQIAAANAFTLNQTAAAVANSDFVSAQANSGIHTYDYGLKGVSLELNGFYSTTNAYRTAIVARAEIIIEIGPDGSNLAVARGFFKPSTRNQSGNVGDLEAEGITYTLSVPDQADVLSIFKWIVDAAATLNTSIQKVITAWQNKTQPRIQYLYDGTNGYWGNAVITSITLSGGLEVMNEFAINGAFSGALTAVP